MAELINLRTARKRANRQEEEKRAAANRLNHGQPKHVRKLAEAQREKAGRQLDAKRLEPGDDR